MRPHCRPIHADPHLWCEVSDKQVSDNLPRPEPGTPQSSTLATEKGGPPKRAAHRSGTLLLYSEQAKRARLYRRLGRDTMLSPEQGKRLILAVPASSLGCGSWLHLRYGKVHAAGIQTRHRRVPTWPKKALAIPSFTRHEHGARPSCVSSYFEAKRAAPSSLNLNVYSSI